MFTASMVTYTESLFVYQSPIHQKVQMNYLIHVPADFRKDEKLPLMVFLHGGGEKGGDPAKIKIHGLPRYASKGGLPVRAVILSPQVPEKGGWNWWLLHEETFELIKKVARKYHVDKDRISMTGLSMGGFGTWVIGTLHPEFFSALAPICGGGMTFSARRLTDTPVRAFHGGKDTVVPLHESQRMVDAVNAAGGKAELIVVSSAGHNSWEFAYEETNLIPWLAAQKRPEKE
ncbi:MAG: dienelactone hydrolase family protein [Clostridia bacterium]|nr:dienelactone hydrolase family protein [Clostridia bacterium]